MALSSAFNGLFWWTVMHDRGTAVANEESLAVVLVFIGTEMMLVDRYRIPLAVTSSVGVGMLARTLWLGRRHAPKIASNAKPVE